MTTQTEAPVLFTVGAEVRETPALNQFIFDQFVTAMEGGVQYWARVKEYHWIKPDAPAGADVLDYQDTVGFRAVLRFENPTGPGMVERVVNRATILRGLRRICTPGGCDFGGREWSYKGRAGIIGAVMDPENSDLDSGDADNIVQAGLFADIVFG